MSESLKIGLVGLDSSHCVEYARLWHAESHPHHVTGARIVAAFAGGSPDWPLSISRVGGFQEQMKNEFGVPSYDSIEEVAAQSDAIMILSVDGRVHLEQFKIVAKSGKPVYIDKPLSVTTADAASILALSAETGTRVFSSSVWRYSRGLNEAMDALGGSCRHAHLHGQWPLEEGLHGWFYYGIHQVEMLYAAMGRGCQSVACARHGSTESITGFWPDGRVGTIVTNHEESRPFAGWLLGAEQNVLVEVKDTKYDRYRAFLNSALDFFRGGAAPVALNETGETIAFMEAAWQSAAQSGIPVEIKIQSS